MWFLFPKERYQYNQIQKAEINSDESKHIENTDSLDEYEKELPDDGNKIDAAMDEAIFFSTFRETNDGSAHQDDDEDDEPMYCDED